MKFSLFLLVSSMLSATCLSYELVFQSRLDVGEPDLNQARSCKNIEMGEYLPGDDDVLLFYNQSTRNPITKLRSLNCTSGCSDDPPIRRMEYVLCRKRFLRPSTTEVIFWCESHLTSSNARLTSANVTCDFIPKIRGCIRDNSTCRIDYALSSALSRYLTGYHMWITLSSSIFFAFFLSSWLQQ